MIVCFCQPTCRSGQPTDDDFDYSLSIQNPVMGSQTRHPDWPKVRRDFLLTDGNGFCLFCGSIKNRQVHHIVSFERCREMELVPKNLMTLCTSCDMDGISLNGHCFFGHCGSWRTDHPDPIRAVREYQLSILRMKKSAISHDEPYVQKGGPPMVSSVPGMTMPIQHLEEQIGILAESLGILSVKA